MEDLHLLLPVNRLGNLLIDKDASLRKLHNLCDDNVCEDSVHPNEDYHESALGGAHSFQMSKKR